MKREIWTICEHCGQMVTSETGPIPCPHCGAPLYHWGPVEQELINSEESYCLGPGVTEYTYNAASILADANTYIVRGIIFGGFIAT